ncbi:caspase-3-like [Uranotaenia lowii]|uniref:caspase-3-like n=1 Tax=Uranotaenia lowii TaxID=190385 RepID=UPI0024786877|nr:caspase-3-like [Uranotaenia lowii]
MFGGTSRKNITRSTSNVTTETRMCYERQTTIETHSFTRQSFGYRSLRVSPRSSLQSIINDNTQPGTSNGTWPMRSFPMINQEENRMTESYDLGKNDAYVLIVHNEKFKDKKMHREGNRTDVELLKNFFSNYRTIPKLKADLTVKDLKEKMKNIRKKNFSKYSCLIVIIMSHGDTNGRIYASDATYDFNNDVVEQILSNKTLKDKPKIFFIQACKGNARMETDGTPTTTNKNDVLKCYSTYEGTLFFRDRKLGTFFIQELFKLLDKNPNTEIREVMNMLRKGFASLK